MNFRPTGLAAGMAALMIASPAMALESYVSFDNFSSTPLSPDRWLEGERGRQVSGEGLSMLQRDWGGTGSDAGTIGLSWSELITGAGPVTQIRAAVKVNALEVTGCGPNPSASRARARLYGTFFNTGVRASGSSVGDVLAQLYVYRDSTSVDAPGVLKVAGSVLMCTNSDCSQSALIGTPASLGNVNVGQALTLQVEWDRPNKRFVFARDSGATSVSVSYTQSDSTEPGASFKGLGTRMDVANCASGARPTAMVDVRFDTVSVNSRAKP